MRVFILEYVTGGGLIGDSTTAPPAGSLFDEGQAMLTAVAGDFQSLPGVQVSLLRHPRLPPMPGCQTVEVKSQSHFEASLQQMASDHDWTLLIAPEINGCLLRVVKLAEQAGARLLSPPSTFVEVAADKWETHRVLAVNQVPLPMGGLLSNQPSGWQAQGGPWLLKDRYGAGSNDVRLVEGRHNIDVIPPSDQLMIEQFCTGAPHSVSCLLGPHEMVTLPTCRQRLSADGRFRYRGGCLPVDPAQDRRGQALARRAVQSLPSACGYVGVDLVLDESRAGAGDRVIEINPRLTTSYVGLRQHCRDNLAEAMIAVANGQSVELDWNDQAIEFGADGSSSVK